MGDLTGGLPCFNRLNLSLILSFSWDMQSRYSLCKGCTLCADTKATKVVVFNSGSLSESSLLSFLCLKKNKHNFNVPNNSITRLCWSWNVDPSHELTNKRMVSNRTCTTTIEWEQGRMSGVNWAISEAGLIQKCQKIQNIVYRYVMWVNVPFTAKFCPLLR